MPSRLTQWVCLRGCVGTWVRAPDLRAEDEGVHLGEGQLREEAQRICTRRRRGGAEVCVVGGASGLYVRGRQQPTD